jgi:hypothetical protein
LKAEEEARLQAEEEARLKAEEEARLQAETEVRLKAEEEARLQVEEESRLKVEEEGKVITMAEETTGVDTRNNTAENDQEYISTNLDDDSISISLDDLCGDDGWGFDPDSAENLDASNSNLDSSVQNPLIPEGTLLRSGKIVLPNSTHKKDAKDPSTSIGGSGSTSFSYEVVATDASDLQATTKIPDDSLSLGSIGDDGWDFDC